jgi:hemerythrin-like domain-containing protein
MYSREFFPSFFIDPRDHYSNDQIEISVRNAMAEYLEYIKTHINDENKELLENDKLPLSIGTTNGELAMYQVSKISYKKQKQKLQP